MKRIGLLLLVAFALGMSGCAVGQKVDIGSAAVGSTHVDGSALYPMSVAVIEDRPFVISGDKTPDFIGKYRGGYGNPWDVHTAGNVPLATQIHGDLVKFLQNTGFPVVAEDAERQVEVRIVNYNFDCFMNCRVWNELYVAIRDENGKPLHSHIVKIEQAIDGSFWVGGKYALERELPLIYAKMLQSIVYSNPEAMAALTRKEEAKPLP